MDIAPHLAGIVREAMNSKGQTILGLSQTTGIPYTTLHSRINGHRPFTITELAAIASALETTVTALTALAEKQPAA